MSEEWEKMGGGVLKPIKDWFSRQGRGKNKEIEGNKRVDKGKVFPLIPRDTFSLGKFFSFCLLRFFVFQVSLHFFGGL